MGDTPWGHLDIAGHRPQRRRLETDGGTGFGTRLLALALDFAPAH